LVNSAFFDVKFHFFLCGPPGAKSTGNYGFGLLLLLLGCCDEAIQHINRTKEYLVHWKKIS
jgi:hypothetical protein